MSNKVKRSFRKGKEAYFLSYDKAKFTCPNCGKLAEEYLEVIPKSLEHARKFVELMNALDIALPIVEGELEVGKMYIGVTEITCEKCKTFWEIPRRFFRFSKRGYVFNFSA